MVESIIYLVRDEPVPTYEELIDLLKQVQLLQARIIIVLTKFENVSDLPIENTEGISVTGYSPVITTT